MALELLAANEVHAMSREFRILLVGAMDTELAGLRKHVSSAPDRPVHAVFPYERAHVAGLELGIVQTHVGDINATMATSEAIRRFNPDHVFKLGCVGGHAEGIHTGDIVVPIGFFHSGAWLTRAKADNTATTDATQWQSLFGEQPYQINASNLGGRAHVLSSDLALTKALVACLQDQRLSYIPAYVGSSTMWFFDRAFMSHVLTAQVPHATTKAWVADMESYAIAQACSVYNKPFTGLYRVSNSDYYNEPYRPDAVAGLFEQPVLNILTAFLHRLATQR